MRRDFGATDEWLKGEAGYTLTEMLVVIAIIGLIAAVLTPNLMGQLGRSRVKAAELQLDTVATAIEAYRADVGRYPSQSEGLAALVTAPPDAETWTGPYLKGAKGVVDPWGRAVIYQAGDEDHDYVVMSYGADGKPGGSGVKRDLRAGQ
ncbi:MAG: type II secretion system major pseudopilin GspG [Burkholderiales bacterium]|jgi:general secretion pathway protein G|nr:type II secretion system major pseudopilin GspG [Burkholderiales bacterium]